VPPRHQGGEKFTVSLSGPMAVRPKLFDARDGI